MISRRTFLEAAAAGVFFAGFPKSGLAEGRNLGKIAVIILEGGMDGLFAVPPIGDQSLFKVRGDLVASKPIKLNPFFGLHPSLAAFSEMLANNEAAIVHATSIPYIRRSHFEGQNLMQTGGLAPFAIKTGWLGRAMDLAKIPGKALALDMPLLIRGANDLDNLYPANIAGTSQASPDVFEALAEDNDGPVAAAFLKLHDRANEIGKTARQRDLSSLAFGAGKQMALPDGPNVAVIRIPEFDTHSLQGRDDGRQPRLLSNVDDVFKSFKAGLGNAWANSIVLTLTEFGRTVRENGSAGTDHGYGTCGLLAGGLIKKANVVANWPGLGNNDMFEGRDLTSTLDYRAVCAAAIEATFGLAHDEIAERIFFEPKLLRIHDLLFSNA